MTEGTDARLYSDHFREWLRHGMTGCLFAARFSSKVAAVQRIAYWTRHGPMLRGDVDALDELIDDSAEKGRFFIALFPHLRSPEEIAQLVGTLSEGDRWTRERVPWGKHSRDDSASLVGLNWLSPKGIQSSVMGFAPLGTMPVSRRAPYVAIALWPGGFANEFRNDPPGEVAGFVDGAHGLKRPKYTRVWNGTKARVRQLLADPPEDRVRFRQAAFCLPKTAASALFAT